jgi:L-lactate dehydrogenase complex protein LldG
MSARDDILSSIRARTRPKAPKPEPYRAPSPPSDLLAGFIDKAQAVFADIQILEREDAIPTAIAELLRARNLGAQIHLPPNSDLTELLDDTRLTVSHDRPGPDDTAVTRAPLAIAETGTLVQPARTASPASWHFRPGFEIAILHETSIVAHFEDALKKIGALPTTLNLITGPSRTGDIEQTMELGAHGPKALAILILRGS